MELPKRIEIIEHLNCTTSSTASSAEVGVGSAQMMTLNTTQTVIAVGDIAPIGVAAFGVIPPAESETSKIAVKKRPRIKPASHKADLSGSEHKSDLILMAGTKKRGRKKRITTVPATQQHLKQIGADQGLESFPVSKLLLALPWADL